MSINISMRVPRSHERVRVVNVKDFRGFSDDKKIEIYGFDLAGNPVLSENDPNLKIVLVGKFAMGVNLSDVFTNGVRGEFKRDPVTKRLRLDNPYIKGFEGIAFMLSRNGLGITPQEVERKITELAKGKVSRIYVYRLANAYGLKENYNKVIADSDEWIFSTTFPSPMDEIDYTMVNLLLEHLHSDWRILDETTAKLLSSSAIKKLIG